MAADPVPPPRYGLQRLRRSLGQFVLGKALGALLGLAWLLLLVRALPAADYGAYLSFYAYMELVLLVSAGGLLALQERFLPELHAAHQDRAAARLAGRALALRMLLLIGAVAALWPLREAVFAQLGLQAYAGLWPLVHAVLLAEGLCRTLDSQHESLFLQARAQASVLLRNGARPLALAALWGASGAAPALADWLQLEAGLMAVAALLALAQGARTRRALRAPAPKESSADPSAVRLLRFALYAFGGQLLWFLSGFDTLKLLVNRGYGLASAALFGFCLALVLMVQRYLPTFLLAGLVRPLFVVARQRPQGAQALADLTALTAKLNLAPLLPLLALAAVYDAPLLAQLSGGRFTKGSAGVLALLLGLLLLQALKHGPSMALAALEDGRGALQALAAGALCFVLLALAVGGQGVPRLLLAALVAEGVEWAVQRARLRAQGVAPQLPWRSLAELLLAAAAGLLAWRALAAALGLGGRSELLGALALLALGTAVLSWRRLLSAPERAQLRALLPPGLRAAPGAVA